MQIKDRQGNVKQIEILHFNALDGWEIQSRFLDFAASSDKAFRRQFVMEVLSHCRVVIGEAAIPVKTEDVVNNHFGTWENIQEVFEAILRHNGIDPETHANKPHFWANAGAEMAVSFIAECSKLIGPAMELTGVLSKED